MLEHAAKYRFDRRLQHRRGWITSEQLDKELGSLLDVAEKADVVESPQGKSPEAAEGDGE